MNAQGKLPFQIQVWGLEEGIKEFFAIEPAAYRKVYGMEPPPLVVALQARVFVEPAGSCRVAASPLEPAGGHDQHDVPEDRGVEPGLALVQAEAPLSGFGALLHGPAEPGGPDQAGLGRELARRDVAVVEGQLAGLQVTADRQRVPRRGGGEPGPGVSPLALRPGARGADLPAPFAPEQALRSVRAGQHGAGSEGEGEVRGDAQDVGLFLLFQELPQRRAGAVDLMGM
jgi:hypothetical protein